MCDAGCSTYIAGKGAWAKTKDIGPMIALQAVDWLIQATLAFVDKYQTVLRLRIATLHTSKTMNTRLLFRASAIAEVLTGLALLVAPTLVVGVLLGEGASPIGSAVARILGIALLSVGVAAWESQGREVCLAPRAGLCIYNVGTAASLSILGTLGGMSALLLWPAVGLHGLAGAAMLWVILHPSGASRDN